MVTIYALEEKGNFLNQSIVKGEADIDSDIKDFNEPTMQEIKLDDPSRAPSAFE